MGSSLIRRALYEPAWEFTSPRRRAVMRKRVKLPASMLRVLSMGSWVLWTCLIEAHAAAQKNYFEIGEIGSSVRVVLHSGDVLRVTLKSNPSTGYGWQILANNSSVLESGPITNLPGDGHKVGTEGRLRREFTAKAEGEDRLVLAYSRPWEKSAAPARQLILYVTVTSQATDPVLAVKPEGVLFGKFIGQSPCADCSGIDQNLMLYTPGPNNFVDAYYVESMTYRDGRNGNTSNVSAGKWFVEKGTATDPNGTVYALSLESSDRMQNYQLRGNTLVPLDPSLKVIQLPFDTSLRRVP
jgi:predicted secreted protein